tara:strand:+ start:17059 stop:17412 length:354 start_codon:yes stop_codon:yes gene_type:complete
MPACATVVGDTLIFGIADEESTLLTQSVSISKKKDKKEARDGCGIVKSVAYYNEMAEISIDGIGASSNTVIGSLLTLAATSTIGITGNVYLEEVSEEFSNEEFSKISIKATAYSGIT